MLLVVFPLTDILCSVGMRVGALAVCFVVQPIALVYITISMVKLSVTIRLAELPLTFVKRAIRPPLFPHAISKTV